MHYQSRWWNMSVKKICILDYGSGNSKSVYNAIKFLKYKVTLSNKGSDIKKSTHLILPGVGSFKKTMEKMKKNLPLKLISNEVLIKKKPISPSVELALPNGLTGKKYFGNGNN